MQRELSRTLRVADMLTTCHSLLRDRYARLALILDLLILAASVWVTAMAFVDPEIAKRIAFPGFSPVMTIGLTAIFTVALSLFQLRVDWKQRSDRHNQAARAYAASKLELSAVLNDATANEHDGDGALRNYRFLGERYVAIPETSFNRLKRKHLIKVQISKEISNHPAAHIWAIRLRLWLTDTIKLLSKSDAGDKNDGEMRS